MYIYVYTQWYISCYRYIRTHCMPDDIPDTQYNTYPLVILSKFGWRGNLLQTSNLFGERKGWVAHRFVPSRTNPLMIAYMWVPNDLLRIKLYIHILMFLASGYTLSQSNMTMEIPKLVLWISHRKSQMYNCQRVHLIIDWAYLIHNSVTIMAYYGK